MSRPLIVVRELEELAEHHQTNTNIHCYIAELEAQVEFKIKECQELAQACNRYKNQLSTKKVTVLTDLRDAIQPDGLINSDASTKTIQAITCAIDAIIDLEND